MSKIFLFFYLISFILCKGPYTIENDVLSLNEQTFGLAIREFKYLLVLFFDPECYHCQQFIPEYEKAASFLKKQNFVLAKLDAYKAEKIANHYDIDAFPKVILLKKNERIVYEGERKAEDIEKWIKEKTKPTFKKITSKRDLEKHKKYDKVFLVYFGNDEKAINELILAERKMDDIPIYTADSEELIKENVKPEKNETMAIFKHFDDKKNIFKDKITSKNIIKFVNLYLYPKVIEFSKETSHIIFTKRNPALVIFSNKKERHYGDSLNLLNYMWPRIKSKIKLFVCDIADPMAAVLAGYCNITEKNIPKVFIVHAENENPLKYEMTGGINEENIMKFIWKWQKGNLKPFIRSEEVPKNNTGDLFILVGKNFKKEVLKNDKDVLIYFVSPWCKVCKEFEPKLGELAKKLKKYNPKLLIAKMDATLNDIEGYQIHNFPTIKFYPGNAKDKEPLNFHTRKNIDSLYRFLKNNTYTKIIEEEDLKKTTDL